LLPFGTLLISETLPIPRLDSSIEERIFRIESSLRDATRSGTVSVLPDFFIDRFLRVSSFEDLAKLIKMKGMEGGGGSIRSGIRQHEVKGGNAVNLGYALGMFRVKVNLLAIANALAADTLSSVVKKTPSVNLSIIEGGAGYTVAFEFMENEKLVNVMVSDSGDLAEFDGSDLSIEQWELLEHSDFISVVNWAAMKRGNELTERVFSIARKKKIKTFFDPADVLELSHFLPEPKKRILDEKMIDYFSMNDNEARIIAKMLAGHSMSQDYSETELKKTAAVLSDLCRSRVDIHTVKMSVTSLDRDVVSRKCHVVNQKIITGAGDVWDAADIIGYMTGLDAEDRLYLSNGAAGLFVSRETAEPPTSEEVIRFLRKEAKNY